MNQGAFVVFFCTANNEQIRVLGVPKECGFVVCKGVVGDPTFRHFDVLAIRRFRFFNSSLAIIGKFIGIRASRNFRRWVGLDSNFRYEWYRLLLSTATIRAPRRFPINGSLYPIVLFNGFRGNSYFRVFQRANAVRGASPALIGFLRQPSLLYLLQFKGIISRQDRLDRFSDQGFRCQWNFKGFKRYLTFIRMVLRRVTRNRVFINNPTHFTSEDVVIVATTRDQVDQVVDATPPTGNHSSIDRMRARKGTFIRRLFRAVRRSLSIANFILASPIIGPSAPRFATRR